MNKTTMLLVMVMITMSSIVLATYNVGNLQNDSLLGIYLPFDGNTSSVAYINRQPTTTNYTSYFNATEYCVVGSSATPSVYMTTFYIPNNSLVYNFTNYMYSSIGGNTVQYVFYYADGGSLAVDAGGCEYGYCSTPREAFNTNYLEEITKVEVNAIFVSASSATSCIKNTTFYYPPPSYFNRYVGNIKTQYYNGNGLVWSNSFEFWGNNSVESLKNEVNTSRTAINYSGVILNDTGANFNGLNGYINTTYLFNYTNTSSFSVCTNIQLGVPSAPDLDGYAINTMNSSSFFGAVNLRTKNSQLRWYIGNNSQNGILYSNEYNAYTNLTHTCITYGGNGSASFYFNGALDTTMTTTIPVNFMSNGYILLGRDSYSEDFNGTIKDLKIYNRSLTSQEISIMYNGGNFSTNVKGEANKSIYLNGYEVIAISNTSNIFNLYPNSSFTSSYWINSEQSNRIYATNKQGVAFQLLIYDYFIQIGAGNHIFNTTPVSGQWRNIINKYDGLNIYTYKDGIILNTTAYASGFTHAYAPPLMIGQVGGTATSWFTQDGTGLKGYLDEFMFYNRYLSPIEIKTLYNGYNNSLLINVYNEKTRALWNDYINLEIIGDNDSNTYLGYNNNIFVNTFSGDINTLRYSSANAYERFHYVNVSNISVNTLNLYLLNESLSTNITYSVYDNNNNLVEGAYVDALRFFIENSSYVSVAQGKTDSNGKSILPIEFNAEFYKLLVYYPFGSLQQESSPAYISSTSQIIQINTIPLPGRLFNATIGVSTPGIAYNNVTTTFTYTFSNVQGTNTVSELNVYQTTPRGTTLINSSSVVASAGTLVLPFTVVNGSSYVGIASLNYSVGGKTYKYIVDSYDLTKFENSSTGNQGIFFAWLLTIIMVFVGYFSIQAMIVLLPLPLLIFAILGLVNIGVPILVAIEVAAIILAVIIS